MLSEFKVSSFRPPKAAQEMFEAWMKRMNSDRPGDVEDKILISILLEQGFRWQQETSSFYEVRKLYEALERYSPSKSRKIDMQNNHLKGAIRTVYKVMGKPANRPKLRALSKVSEVRDALKMEKSAGLPTMGKKEDNFYYCLNREEQIRKLKKAANACLAQTRTQLGGKVRLVWAYPLEMTIMEARFAAPLIQEFKGLQTPMAIAQSTMKLGARVWAIDALPGSTRALDFSKFDSTIPAALIYKAFDILGTWFSEEDKEEWGWKQIVGYFVHTPICMPNGKIYRGKRHGVPSGSYFTQLIDSVVNMIIQFYMARKLGYNLDKDNFMVLGDDVIISIPTHVTTTAYAKELADTFGMIVHPDKTKEIPHFLGALWKNGLPYRPMNEILQKMAYPESARIYQGKTYEERRLEAAYIILSYATQYVSGVPLLKCIVKDDWMFGRRINNIPNELKQKSIVLKAKEQRKLARYLTGQQRFEQEYMATKHVYTVFDTVEDQMPKTYWSRLVS